MLLDLRETVRNSKPLKYSLITLICIPFALVGIGSYFSGGTAAAVAEVNGVPIDRQQLERAYQQQRQQLARMFGGQLPEAFANEPALREQALQQLITQQVLESEVAKQKFAVGDSTLGRAIRGLPNFQSDGRFDKDTYEMQLRASGLSVPAFEQ
ncbi:MAG: peptidyl-prolyl cis-trans isomerase D, partial [Gammaproteobacteria bacterium]